MNHIHKASVFFLGLGLFFFTSASHAGSVDELKHEISFLAKKLLDKSGEDKITVKQAATRKPFVGVCPEPGAKGIKLACVTPGHGAADAGLETGDLVIAIDNVSMLGAKHGKYSHDSPYHKVFDSLETGKKMIFTLLRNEKQMDIQVTVGSIEHPAYTLTISKDEID